MIAIWDDKLLGQNEDSDQSSKEVDYVCLMALEDEFEDDEAKFSYDKLLEAFHELDEEFKCLGLNIRY